MAEKEILRLHLDVDLHMGHMLCFEHAQCNSNIKVAGMPIILSEVNTACELI